MPVNSIAVNIGKVVEDDTENISRTTSVVLLVVSIGLVAVCADFLVESINSLVSSNSGLSEAFVGLIILPIA
jgi:Ca2+/H+ antiporter